MNEEKLGQGGSSEHEESKHKTVGYLFTVSLASLGLFAVFKFFAWLYGLLSTIPMH